MATTKNTTTGAKPSEAVKQITYLAAALKAPRITEAATRLADQARDANWTHEDYLAAVLDWFSRRVLSWRVSISMDASFCVEALEEAMVRHGRPDIFNTDQGSQFSSQAFTEVLLKAGIAISMDGRGAWRDNVFVERLWRSVKYEEVYLKAYETVSEARASIGRYLAFYNGRRPHSSLDRQTPDQAYFTRLPQIAAA